MWTMEFEDLLHKKLSLLLTDYGYDADDQKGNVLQTKLDYGGSHILRCKKDALSRGDSYADRYRLGVHLVISVFLH